MAPTDSTSGSTMGPPPVRQCATPTCTSSRAIQGEARGTVAG
jgi:hypothetical protein